jgi:hypothetical protein
MYGIKEAWVESEFATVIYSFGKYFNNKIISLEAGNFKNENESSLSFSKISLAF